MELCNICFFVYIYVTWQLAFILGLVSADENETEIRQKVLKDYDRSITPILYARSEHKSYIAMNVFRIQGLDEVKGEFILEGVTHVGDLLQMNYSTTDLKHKAYVLTNFLIENNLWKLLSAKSESKRMVVDVDIVSDVGVFILVIERSMPLIALAVLTPSLVSVIILLTTFWMEAGCLIRAGINFTSILVSAGNLFTISRILPVTGAVTPAIVEYVSSVLILCMLSSFQAIAMSFLTRCKKQPPISYTTISEKFPNWALMMLALVPRSEETAIVDETFLFSDLTGRDQRSNLQTEDRKEENDTKIIKLHYPWEKHILLWERLLFYLFIIVILLLIVSVIITE
ncbi:uncharacterized protein LOC129960303 isoform X3 [Argiope bruennichi]|uniref:uncharacterized protein LOC129960303 isoform X3 n=1 Tax=Argiope bruennichi TaxID=94029 RepID=UPI00249445F1|nr:uncharacterized protein LOC129960303 isoform X3 [Argiope bruennichi]